MEGQRRTTVPPRRLAFPRELRRRSNLSQSIIGLTFQGPRVFGGGQVNASLFLDLWGGTPTSSLNHLVRMRVATVSLDWKNSSLTLGQDKPIVSPREPNSLAQVAFSPLTAAGNLWLWQPQIRFEQRFSMSDNMGLRAQAGVYQTSEPAASAGAVSRSLRPARPLKDASNSGATWAAPRAWRSLPDFTPARRMWPGCPFLPDCLPSIG